MRHVKYHYQRVTIQNYNSFHNCCNLHFFATICEFVVIYGLVFSVIGISIPENHSMTELAHSEDQTSFWSIRKEWKIFKFLAPLLLILLPAYTYILQILKEQGFRESMV